LANFRHCRVDLKWFAKHTPADRTKESRLYARRHIPAGDVGQPTHRSARVAGSPNRLQVTGFFVGPVLSERKILQSLSKSGKSVMAVGNPLEFLEQPGSVMPLRSLACDHLFQPFPEKFRGW
jgi:hypothetical protein